MVIYKHFSHDKYLFILYQNHVNQKEKEAFFFFYMIIWFSATYLIIYDLLVGQNISSYSSLTKLYEITELSPLFVFIRSCSPCPYQNLSATGYRISLGSFFRRKDLTVLT